MCGTQAYRPIPAGLHRLGLEDYHKGRGSPHKLSFHASPRLRGPLPRGTAAWHTLSAARTASERTNRDAQAVSDHGRLPKLQGLQAFRCLGAIRTLAPLLRRAMPLILAATYTLGHLRPVTT